MGTNWSSACSTAVLRENRDASLRTSIGISVTPARTHRHPFPSPHPSGRVFRSLCRMERLSLLLLVEAEARHEAPSVAVARVVLGSLVRMQRSRHCGLDSVYAKQLAIGIIRQSRLPIDKQPVLRNIFELPFRHCLTVYPVRSLSFRHRQYVTT